MWWNKDLQNNEKMWHVRMYFLMNRVTCMKEVWDQTSSERSAWDGQSERQEVRHKINARDKVVQTLRTSLKIISWFSVVYHNLFILVLHPQKFKRASCYPLLVSGSV